MISRNISYIYIRTIINAYKYIAHHNGFPENRLISWEKTLMLMHRSKYGFELQRQLNTVLSPHNHSRVSRT